MSKEAVFKTSAFGFNKDDVMNYINIQKAEEARLLKKIDELKNPAPQEENTDNIDNSQELAEAESHISALRQEKREIEEEKNLLSQKLQISEKVMLEKDEEISALRVQLDGYMRAANQASSEIKPDSIYADKDQEHIKDLESQLGSAIIDARRYSDRLVSEAKSKSAKISSAVYLAINETTGKVNSLSKEMENFKGDFEESLRELTIKLEALSKNLDGTANDIVEQLEKNKLNTDCIEA